jgi:repressor LexA
VRLLSGEVRSQDGSEATEERRFTEKQGQYLAFIDSYMTMYARAPAEADLQRFFRSTPPTVHQMILKLEEKGLFSRASGEARSIKLLVGRQKIPRLNRPKRNG